MSEGWICEAAAAPRRMASWFQDQKTENSSDKINFWVTTSVFGVFMQISIFIQTRVLTSSAFSRIKKKEKVCFSLRTYLVNYFCLENCKTNLEERSLQIRFILKQVWWYNQFITVTEEGRGNLSLRVTQSLKIEKISVKICSTVFSGHKVHQGFFGVLYISACVQTVLCIVYCVALQ